MEVRTKGGKETRQEAKAEEDGKGEGWTSDADGQSTTPIDLTSGQVPTYFYVSGRLGALEVAATPWRGEAVGEVVREDSWQAGTGTSWAQAGTTEVPVQGVSSERGPVGLKTWRISALICICSRESNK